MSATIFSNISGLKPHHYCHLLRSETFITYTYCTVETNGTGEKSVPVPVA
jgi:hypothetical protein